MNARCVTAAIVLVLSSSVAAGEREILLLRGWIDAVDTHAVGQSDAALAVVTAWAYDDLELMRPYVEALVLAPSSRNGDRLKRRQRTRRDGPAILELTR